MKARLIRAALEKPQAMAIGSSPFPLRQYSGAYGSSAVDVRKKIESKIRISGTDAPIQDWITIAQIGAVNAKRHHIVAVSTAQGRGPPQ
jgi:hypothetical protein